jgi:hypothetical protein
MQPVQVPGPAEARNDALAVFALLGGLFLPPFGLLFGHLSNRAAFDAGRRRSPLAVTGLYLAYTWVDLAAGLVLYLVYPAPAAFLIPGAVIIAVATVNRRRRSRKN